MRLQSPSAVHLWCVQQVALHGIYPLLVFQKQL